MRNRKNDILNASRLLFNKLGYSQVTIRMIAQELHISSGNLNYHFKKREDILEALYFEMVADFDNRIAEIEDVVFTLEKIKEDITTSMFTMFEYQFFWTDLYNLLSLSPSIKKHFEKVYLERVKGYNYLFDKLIEVSILNRFEFAKQQNFVIERMIGFSNTFIYTSSLYPKKQQNFIEEQSSILLAILFPYLTSIGKKEFKKLVPNFME